MTWRHTAGGRAGAPALAAALAALSLFCVCFAQPAHAETVTLGLGGWQVQSSALAAQAGSEISQPGFPTGSWLAVSPDGAGAVGTEIDALLQNGDCPDVFFSEDMRSCFGVHAAIGARHACPSSPCRGGFARIRSRPGGRRTRAADRQRRRRPGEPVGNGHELAGSVAHGRSTACRAPSRATRSTSRAPAPRRRTRSRSSSTRTTRAACSRSTTSTGTRSRPTTTPASSSRCSCTPPVRSRLAMRTSLEDNAPTSPARR